MSIIIGIALAALTIILRLVPHSPNFVPVAALALWAGAYLPKKWGVLVPMAVMFISDAIIGFYDWRLMLVVYASFAIMFFVGMWVRNNKSVSRVVLGSLSGSMFFFLATNFAVWAMSSWYAHNFTGLMEAYAMGAPFFRNTVLGDLFYNGMFFGVYALAEAFIRRKSSVFDLGAHVG